MPELTLATKIQRQQQILEVIRLRAEAALTVRDACDQVGIAPTTYYRHVHANNDILEELQESMVAQEKEHLTNLVLSRYIVHDQINEYVINHSLTLKEAMALSDHLGKILEQLDYRTREASVANIEAKEFLEKGPYFQHPESKSASPVSVDLSE